MARHNVRSASVQGFRRDLRSDGVAKRKDLRADSIFFTRPAPQYDTVDGVRARCRNEDMYPRIDLTV